MAALRIIGYKAENTGEKILSSIRRVNGRDMEGGRCKHKTWSELIDFSLIKERVLKLIEYFLPYKLGNPPLQHTIVHLLTEIAYDLHKHVYAK